MSFKSTALAALMLAGALVSPTLAQTSGVTTVVVPFPAGGTLDVLARIVTQKVGEQTGESYIVENRPGANGMIGAKAAAKAKPDGKTWLIADGAPVIINPFLYPADPTFSADKDLRPVRAIASQPFVLVVNPKVPARSLKEFIELSRTREVTHASAGIGTPGHLTMAYLSNLSGGLKFLHVPYKGGPQVMQGLITGEVEAGFIILPNVLPFVQRGELIALAVSSPKRSPHLPNVPTMVESGYPAFDFENRYFAWVPTGTPDDVAKKMDASLLAALSDAGVAERIRGSGLDPLTNMGEAESRKWLAANRELWSKVIRENNIKPE
jgi:tripartite-type tricarboxylate transporter receptor subunit TctC